MNTDINNRDACPVFNRPAKTEVEYVIDGFITNVKEPKG